jgi:hypothetical protein
MTNDTTESCQQARPSSDGISCVCFARTLCLIVALLVMPSLSSAQAFTDGFEGTSINPFWTVEGYPAGAGSLTNSVARTGNQSLMLNAAEHAYHDFGAPQTGSISVWILGSQVCCGEGAGLQVYDPGYSKWTLLATGTGGSEIAAGYGVGSDQTYYHVPSSPSDWHHLEIHIDASGARTLLDGVTIANNPDITSFQAVELVIWGGGSSGTVYFDDFWTDASPVVHYGVCLLYDQTRAKKSGSTIPIKLQLCTATGEDVSSAGLTLHGVSITQDSTTVSGPIDDSGNANPDNDFRFDSSLGPTGGYIFNLSTLSLTTGTYRLNFTVSGDSTIYWAPFQVK